VKGDEFQPCLMTKRCITQLVQPANTRSEFIHGVAGFSVPGAALTPKASGSEAPHLGLSAATEGRVQKRWDVTRSHERAR